MVTRIPEACRDQFTTLYLHRLLLYCALFGANARFVCILGRELFSNMFMHVQM